MFRIGLITRGQVTKGMFRIGLITRGKVNKGMFRIGLKRRRKGMFKKLLKACLG